ncbi:leucine-rich repeat-containing protein 75A isoform X2 [Lepisosteus oculatus]
MGTKQTKGGGPESGESPQHGPASWKRTPTKERGDIFASLVLKPGERFGKGATPPPYLRRVGMIQEMMAMAQQGKQDEATELLKNLRQDLGMESTSLDDVLYRYASFRNLVDPITHELIISLARYVHCPKTEGDALGAMEKVCRQLTYHLSPHSQWRRQGLMKRKPQACLKAILSSSPINNTVDLSGIPLTVKDMERLASFLQQNSDRVTSVELCFTELTDEAFLQLLPTLGMLPLLNTLSLNGNRLTKAVLRDLTDTLKDPEKFPSVTWIDLGNNVDIFSLPQPFLVSLRKRCPKQGNLPTILEFGESQMSDMESHDGNLSECLDDLGSEAEDSRQSPSPTSTPSQSQLVSKSEKPMGGETGDQVVMLAANQT